MNINCICRHVHAFTADILCIIVTEGLVIVCCLCKSAWIWNSRNSEIQTFKYLHMNKLFRAFHHYADAGRPVTWSCSIFQDLPLCMPRCTSIQWHLGLRSDLIHALSYGFATMQPHQRSELYEIVINHHFAPCTEQTHIQKCICAERHRPAIRSSCKHSAADPPAAHR